MYKFIRLDDDKLFNSARAKFIIENKDKSPTAQNIILDALKYYVGGG